MGSVMIHESAEQFIQNSPAHMIKITSNSDTFTCGLCYPSDAPRQLKRGGTTTSRVIKLHCLTAKHLRCLAAADPTQIIRRRSTRRQDEGSEHGDQGTDIGTDCWDCVDGVGGSDSPRPPELKATNVIIESPSKSTVNAVHITVNGGSTSLSIS